MSENLIDVPSFAKKAAAFFRMSALLPENRILFGQPLQLGLQVVGSLAASLHRDIDRSSVSGCISPTPRSSADLVRWPATTQH